MLICSGSLLCHRFVYSVPISTTQLGSLQQPSNSNVFLSSLFRNFRRIPSYFPRLKTGGAASGRMRSSLLVVRSVATASASATRPATMAMNFPSTVATGTAKSSPVSNATSRTGPLAVGRFVGMASVWTTKSATMGTLIMAMVAANSARWRSATTASPAHKCPPRLSSHNCSKPRATTTISRLSSLLVWSRHGTGLIGQKIFTHFSGQICHAHASPVQVHLHVQYTRFVV